MKPEPPILPPPAAAVPAKSKRRRNGLVYLVIGLCLVTLVLVVVFKKRTPPVTVQTEKVARRNLTEVVVANGKIQPVIQVPISAEVSGEITELPVKEGQFVHKGDLLLKIKPDFYVAALNQSKAAYESSLNGQTTAQATLEKAEADYKRNRELFDRKLISEADYIGFKTGRDIAKAQLNSSVHQVEMAQASVASAEEQLAKTTIVSPIEGTVSRLKSQVGERVLGTVQNAGTEIMTIADLNEMETRVDIGEMDVVLIQPGQKVRLEVDAFKDKKFPGTVTQIANSSKASGLTASAYTSSQSQEATKFEVRIHINEKEFFRPGMSVTAEIETRYRTNALTVPLASVTTRPPKPPEKKAGSATNNASAATNAVRGSTNNVSTSSTNAVAADKKSKDSMPKLSEVVFVLEGDHVKMAPVKIGICDDNYWEITDGLAEGQEIVVGGYRAISRDLADGKKVKKGVAEADTNSK
ncbi:MAG: efflux RND transporter periplasmic adaptor subunit [Verrucomicrobiales bacterium]|nr:efflux RND transporter periplasmic adaptor subunit [Verrucomicrobiales bacterium]